MLCGGASYVAVIYLLAFAAPQVGGFGLIFSNFGFITLSAFFDHIGFCGGPHRNMTWLKLLGILVFFAGLLVATLVDLLHNSDSKQYINPYILCYWLAGMIAAVRISFDMNTAKAVHYTTQGPALNYISGTCLSLLIFGANFAINRDTPVPEYNLPEWYECFPGVIEAVFTGTAIIVARKVGMGVFSMIRCMAMIAFGFFIDAEGLLGTEKRPMANARVGGLILLILGCFIIIASIKSSGVEEENVKSDDVAIEDLVSTVDTRRSEVPELVTVGGG